jgi:hypothetical protein
MNKRIKQWIDAATYQDLLRKWRFASVGDPMFQGEIGEYYSKVMAEKRKTADHIQVSKNVGWDK